MKRTQILSETLLYLYFHCLRANKLSKDLKFVKVIKEKERSMSKYFGMIPKIRKKMLKKLNKKEEWASMECTKKFTVLWNNIQLTQKRFSEWLIGTKQATYLLTNSNNGFVELVPENSLNKFWIHTTKDLNSL